jgi:hypothetical protein
MLLRLIAHLNHRPRRRHGIRAAITVVGLASALAACGGGSKTPGSTSPTATTKASLSAYTACLKQHGLSFAAGGGFPGAGGGAPGAGGGTPPSLPPGGSSGNAGTGFPVGGNSKFQQAFKACASLQPKGSAGFRGGFPGSRGVNSTAFAAYRNCLKLHGVALASGFGPRGASGASGTLNSAKGKAALTACASLRPSGPTGASGSTSAPSS